VSTMLLTADGRFLGYAGPDRTLPDSRVHQIFEERARTQPNAVAVVLGTSRLTYRELNARANRLARAILAQHLPREGVVGVVTERNLDWLTAVLAIFKAGGAYLPIDPQFPAERVAQMLARAGCRLILTEPGSTSTLDQALPSVPQARKLFIDPAIGEHHLDGNLDVAVSADQLAYIFFTSGSTGEPKGAMCEHAGLLNHLFAKIDDLGLGAADVVAQSAPQCFDISLWQLLAALLVGGQTVIVEQGVILDASRFLDALADARVSVAQVVPSYLEVLVSCLESEPSALPHLRGVLATGEALKRELVRRWFEVQPGVRLINAYGLTETSDDTNHEIMTEVPGRASVPLGRPVNNVHVYVVDEEVQPVPPGEAGEIVFSGVCVGRGYINDAERTQIAFLADPHAPGRRLYKSGDYGRWLPDGSLEFQGRRDSQVKISGFRIEIGEIENQLLEMPGIRESAVVVAEGLNRRQLVAFYTGTHRPDPAAIRERLGALLPAYMVPSAFHWLETMPLTGNGKIDRKALTALTGTVAITQKHEAPKTPTERRLVAIWAEALGIPADKIGRRDHFFDLGGTSLSALKLAAALGGVPFKEVAAHPVLADQASLLDGAGRLVSS